MYVSSAYDAHVASAPSTAILGLDLCVCDLAHFGLAIPPDLFRIFLDGVLMSAIKIETGPCSPILTPAELAIPRCYSQLETRTNPWEVWEASARRAI